MSNPSRHLVFGPQGEPVVIEASEVRAWEDRAIETRAAVAKRTERADAETEQDERA